MFVAPAVAQGRVERDAAHHSLLQDACAAGANAARLPSPHTNKAVCLLCVTLVFVNFERAKRRPKRADHLGCEQESPWLERCEVDLMLVRVLLP